MFHAIVSFLFLTALVFAGWATVRATQSGSADHSKDRIFMIKTSWIMLFTSILWFAMAFVQVYAYSTGIIYLVSPFNAFGWHFIVALVFAWKTHVFNKMAKELKKE